MPLLEIQSFLIDPPDDELRKSLHQYSKEKLSTNQRLARLQADHGLTIAYVNSFLYPKPKCSLDIPNLNGRAPTLYKLNRRFEVPSVRKMPATDIAIQAVLEKVANDISQGQGVGTIGTLLSNEGMPLPR